MGIDAAGGIGTQAILAALDTAQNAIRQAIGGGGGGTKVAGAGGPAGAGAALAAAGAGAMNCMGGASGASAGAANVGVKSPAPTGPTTLTLPQPAPAKPKPNPTPAPTTVAAPKTAAPTTVAPPAAKPPVNVTPAPGPSAAVGAVGTGAALLQPVKAGLSGSPVAQQVFSALEQYHARLDTMTDAEFNKLYPGAAGVFVPNENRIIMPASVANNPDKVKLILLHEGVHWLQDNVKGGAEALGGPIGQALQAANAIRTYPPNTKQASWHDEAQAYMIEANVAQQLNLTDGGLGTQNGKVLNYDQVMARIAAEPIYN